MLYINVGLAMQAETLATINKAASAYGLSDADIDPRMMDILKKDEGCIAHQLPRILRLTAINNALRRRGLEPLSLTRESPGTAQTALGTDADKPFQAASKPRPPPRPKPKPKEMTQEERRVEEALCVAGIDDNDVSILDGNGGREVCGVGLDYYAYRSVVKHCRIRKARKAMGMDGSIEAATTYILKWMQHIARNRWRKRLHKLNMVC